jgi:L-asparaginase type II
MFRAVSGVRTALAAAGAAMVMTLPLAADNAKARIVIVATGGTIAGSAESTTAAGYQSGAVAVDVLIAAVPQMKKFADVTGVQVASVGSQDMNDELWIKLATEVNRLLGQPDVDGVAITHGTDTMEETAYFLNLVVKSDKPVVLTGSMRPSTSLSADGPLNIYNAVGVASDPRAKGRGVLVVANDDIHGARAVTKRHTTDVETFVSPEAGLIGVCLFDGDSLQGGSRADAAARRRDLRPRRDVSRPDRCGRRQRREGAGHRRRRRWQHDDGSTRRGQAGDREGCRGRALEPRRRWLHPAQHRGG